MALPALSPALCHHTLGSGGGRAQTAPLPLTLLQNPSTSTTGIQKQSKPTPPTARLCGLQGSPEPFSSHLAPSWALGVWEPILPMAVGAGAFCALQVTIAPANLTTSTRCRSASSTFLSLTSPLPPNQQRPKPFPFPSCRTQSPTCDLRVS